MSVVATTAIPVAEPAAPASTRKVLFASTIGTVFEYYDFYLYGTLAVFFGGLFFPEGNATAQLLASLATFGAGFGVRPLGAVVFGHIGDRIGRKYVMWVSILGVLPFTLLLPYASLFWTDVLTVIIGLVMASAFSAIVVFAQELVPGPVPEAVVELLEPVEIEHDEAEAGAGACTACDLAQQIFVKGAMVPEAGEAVGERRLRKPRELGFTCALDPSPVADEAAEDDERREEA